MPLRFALGINFWMHASCPARWWNGGTRDDERASSIGDLRIFWSIHYTTSHLHLHLKSKKIRGKEEIMLYFEFVDYYGLSTAWRSYLQSSPTHSFESRKKRLFFINRQAIWHYWSCVNFSLSLSKMNDSNHPCRFANAMLKDRKVGLFTSKGHSKRSVCDVEVFMICCSDLEYWFTQWWSCGILELWPLEQQCWGYRSSS